MDFRDLSESPPEDSEVVVCRFFSSREERSLWCDVRDCAKCGDIPSVLDARSDGKRVNRYSLNIENPISPSNPRCFGKFIGEGPAVGTMVVGMNPGVGRKLGDRTLRGVGPTSGSVFGDLLDGLDVDVDSVYLTNAAKCSAVDSKRAKNILPAKVAGRCFPFLLREIDIVRPQRIVGLGVPVRQVFHRKFGTPDDFSMKPSITEINGAMIEVWRIPHPSAYVSESEKRRYLQAALAPTM